MFNKFIAAAALLLGGWVGAQAAPSISVTPSLNTVTVGQNFVLNIDISGITDLYGWQLDLDFGPAGLVNATAVTEGSFLGLGTIFGPGTINNGAAAISTLFSALTGASGVTGGGVLASVSFMAVAIGTATVSVLNVQLSDSNLDPIFFNFPGDALSATVSVVPEPASLALLSLGLACISLGLRRSARAARAR